MLELIEWLEGYTYIDKIYIFELFFCTAFQHIQEAQGHFTESFYKLAVEVCKS